MNPKIFHPEWFIRKRIVEEWDYSQDQIISLPDMTQMELPNDRQDIGLVESIFNTFITRK